MEYYLMKTNVVNPVFMVLLQQDEYTYSLTDENFMKMPDMSVAYYEYKNDVMVPDIFIKPTFMVSDIVKNTISMYDELVDWKNIVLLPNKESDLAEASMQLNIPNLYKCDCLSADVVRLPNGELKEIIIDKDKLVNKDIFQIDNVITNEVVVSLRLAESILRRDVLGIKFEKVKVV